EFDPFYHARVIREIVRTGSVPEQDPFNSWPEGMAMKSIYPPAYHYSAAIAYWVAAPIFGVQGYNQDFFVKVLSYIIPLFGAVGVIAFYFIGKQLRDRKTGLIASLLLMLQPAYIYPVMFAEAEKDAAGLAFMFIAFAALLWAMKKPDWKRGLIAGAAFALSIWTWRMTGYMAAIIAAFIGIQLVVMWLAKEKNRIIDLAEMMLFFAVPVLSGQLLLNIYMIGLIPSISNPISAFMNIIFIFPAVILPLIAAYFLKPSEKKAVAGLSQKKLINASLAALLVVAGIGVLIAHQQIYASSIGLVMNTLKPAGGKLLQTVAEDRSTDLNGVLAGLNWLALFYLAGLITLTVRRIVKFKDTESMDALPLIWSGAALMMIMWMVKFSLQFAPTAALVSALFFSDVISFTAKKLGSHAKTAAIAVTIIILFTQVGIAIQQIESQKQSYPVQSGWFKALEYIKNDPNPDTAFLTWWDYGHWTAFLAEKHAIVDNLNANESKVLEVARVFTEWRGNTTEIEERNKPWEEYWKVTHVGVDRVLLTNKWGALTFLSDRQCIPTHDLASYGLEFPQLTEASQNICGYGMTYAGDIGMSACEKKTLTSEVGSEEYVECNMFQGAPVRFTTEQWDDIVNAKWPGYDLTVGSPQGGSIRLKVYGQPDYKIMFFHAGGRIVQDAPANYMFGLRVFFKDPSFKYHQLVENDLVPNEEVVVYKFLPEGA
ncbi:MAG: glycosyltransferase family 39 protein, partial [Candidatus Diapherotrites archaeon]|nr:glycosyltransferase family 39 protein [Candidatus Diapherotrites archaeon]